jgi:hypothetical protein
MPYIAGVKSGVRSRRTRQPSGRWRHPGRAVERPFAAVIQGGQANRGAARRQSMRPPLYKRPLGDTESNPCTFKGAKWRSLGIALTKAGGVLRQRALR